MAEAKKYRGVRKLDRTFYILFLMLSILFLASGTHALLWAPTEAASATVGPILATFGPIVAGLLCGASAFGYRRLSRLP